MSVMVLEIPSMAMATSSSTSTIMGVCRDKALKSKT